MEAKILKILSVLFLIWAVASTSLFAYYYNSYQDIRKAYETSQYQLNNYKSLIDTLQESINQIRDSLSELNLTYSELLMNYSLLIRNFSKIINSGYVSIIIDFGNGTRFYKKVYVVYGVNNTVFFVLKTLEMNFSYTEYPELNDVFINCIGGVCSQQLTDNSGMYWMLYVNTMLSSFGANQTKVYDGDVIEWKYENLSW